MAEEKKQAVPSDEISLKEVILKSQEWFRYLRSKWLVIVVAGVIGGGLGLLYSILKKPQYIATLTFALEEKSQGSQLGAYAGIASQFGINLGGGGTGGAFSGDNIMDLMKSRLMISKALLSSIKVNGKDQSLANYYMEFNNHSKKTDTDPVSISFPVNGDPDSLTYAQDSLMGNLYQQVLKKNLTVDKIDKNSGIIAVICKSPDQLFAKYFTEALVKNVSAFYIQTRTKRASSNLEILQSRLDSVRRAYSGALYGTAVSIDQNLNPARAVVNVPRIKSQTEAQMLGGEYAELAKNVEIAKMALLQETPLVQVIDRPILPLQKERLGKIKGILIGGFLAGVLLIIFLPIKKVLEQIISS